MEAVLKGDESCHREVGLQWDGVLNSLDSS